MTEGCDERDPPGMPMIVAGSAGLICAAESPRVIRRGAAPRARAIVSGLRASIAVDQVMKRATVQRLAGMTSLRAAEIVS